jgi:hypothetical protein
MARDRKGGTAASEEDGGAMIGEHTPDGVPDWLLERYRLGELPASQLRQVDQALASVPAVRLRLEELESSSARLLAEVPPAALAAAVRTAAARDTVERQATRAEPSSRGAARSSRGAAGRVPSLATAALGVASLVGLLVWAPWAAQAPEADVTRIKGVTPYLLVYRKAATDVERLPPAAVARPHDVVQLAYQAAGRRYGVIVSVDGRGVVTRHLPVAGGEAVPLRGGVPVALAQSYELDDAPGFERFVLVAADEPFGVDQVEEAVRREHETWGSGANERRLDLPDSMDQFSLVLRKESSR